MSHVPWFASLNDMHQPEHVVNMTDKNLISFVELIKKTRAYGKTQREGHFEEIRT